MGYEVKQDIILRILGPIYTYLDSLDSKKDIKELVNSCRSYGDWPDLNEALFEWQ